MGAGHPHGTNLMELFACTHTHTDQEQPITQKPRGKLRVPKFRKKCDSSAAVYLQSEKVLKQLSSYLHAKILIKCVCSI